MVAADAVRLVRAQPTGANLAVLTVRGNPLNDRAHQAVIPALLSKDRPPVVEYDSNSTPVVVPQPNLQSFGKALAFDGINDFVMTPALNAYFPTRSVTMEFWFNAEAAGVMLSELGQAIPDTTWHDSQVEILATGEVRARVWNVPTVSLGTVTFGSWHHVAVTYEDRGTFGYLNAYLDGVHVASTTGQRQTPQAAGHQLHYALGAADSSGLGQGPGAAFRGKIDEFRLWNEARDVVSVASNRSRRLAGDEAGLVLYWRFDLDPSDGLTADFSPNNLWGALGGGLTASVPVGAVGVPMRGFVVLLEGSDDDDDTLTWNLVSSAPEIRLTLVGQHLIIDANETFVGTATVTVEASDATGGVHDHRGRRGRASFEVSLGANTIYGSTFWDADNDGLRSTAERGVDGRLVYIDGNGNGTYDVGETFAYSDVNGDYALRDIRLRSSPGGRAVVSAQGSTDPRGGLVVTESSESAPFDHVDTVTRTEVIASFTLVQNFLFSSLRTGGTIVLLPEMTSDNVNVSDLAADIMQRLSQAGLGNHIFVQVDAGSRRIAFLTSSGAFSSQLTMSFSTHVRTVRTTYYTDGSSYSQLLQDVVNPGALGFSAQAGMSGGYGSLVVWAGASTTPDGGARVASQTELPPFLRRDTSTNVTAQFQFTVDDVLLGSITLTPERVRDNVTAEDLVLDINQLLALTGMDSQVVANLDTGHLTFSTVRAGSSTRLVVEVQQRWVSTRVTTRLDGSTFEQVVADYITDGGLGFGRRALATGSDQPQSSLDVLVAPRSDWVAGVSGSRITVPVAGPGQILSGVAFGDRHAVTHLVHSVRHGSSAWSEVFTLRLNASGLNPVSLPWIGVDRITLSLPARIAEALEAIGLDSLNDALTVSGMDTGAQNFTAELHAPSNTLTLHFPGPLATDFYTVRYAASGVAALGVDAGTDYVVSFAVQPGDINGDGRTNDLDLYQVWRNSRLPLAQRSVLADLNGDGAWDAVDMEIVRANYRVSNPGAAMVQTAGNGGAATTSTSSTPAGAAARPVSLSIHLNYTPPILAKASLSAMPHRPQDDSDLAPRADHGADLRVARPSLTTLKRVRLSLSKS
jgi:hypothetical protein